jgi:hypothetical protein
VGVTGLSPFKGFSPPRFEHSGKKLWVVCSEFFFMLPGSFIFGVMTPVHFAHLDGLTASHSLCGIKDPDWPLTVS